MVVFIVTVGRTSKVKYDLGFEILTAVSVKCTIFWVVTPCGSVKFILTARHYNPEDVDEFLALRVNTAISDVTL
jgi:hypothetical protein